MGKQLGVAIRSAIDAKGVRPADVARTFKVRPPSVQGWMDTGRISKPNLFKLIEYCADVVGPEHWGLTASAEPRQATEHAYIEGGSVVVIPHMNGRAKGGGGGLAPTHEYVVGSISVTLGWIHRKLPAITAKQNLVVIEAYGRSMEPTLTSGDLLIVDTGVHDAKIDGIYILERKNTPEPEIMVKRLQRTIDGGMIVRSDNRAEYDPETVKAVDIKRKIRILGRVVWVWAGREA